MEFQIKLAGLVIGISSLYDEIYRLCKDYVCNEAESFHISITGEDIMREQEYSLMHNPEMIPSSDSYLETLAVYRKIASRLPFSNIWLMHGSAVAVNGEAVLFTAPSGVGKTTHSRLWLNHIPSATVINGDKPLLRLQDGVCEICGTPWSGKEHMNCNRIVPLRAICLLQRGKENRVTETAFDELRPALIQQTFRPDDPAALTKIIDLLEETGHYVKCYRLSCTMEPEAATVAYNAIFQNH